MFRVKVMIRSLSDGLEKIEYFNNISSWEVYEKNLVLWRERPDGSGLRVATIAEWAWVKLDE